MDDDEEGEEGGAPPCCRRRWASSCGSAASSPFFDDGGEVGPPRVGPAVVRGSSSPPLPTPRPVMSPCAARQPERRKNESTANSCARGAGAGGWHER